jgi:hypothetical protein
MLYEGSQLGLVFGETIFSIKRFIVTKESKHRIRFEKMQPLIGRWKKTDTFMMLQVRVKVLSTGKSPLGSTGGVGTKAWSIAWPRHVAIHKFMIRESKVQFRFDSAEPGVSFCEPIPNQNDAFTLGWRIDFLRPDRGSGWRINIYRMRSTSPGLS